MGDFSFLDERIASSCDSCDERSFPWPGVSFTIYLTGFLFVSDKLGSLTDRYWLEAIGTDGGSVTVVDVAFWDVCVRGAVFDRRDDADSSYSRVSTGDLAANKIKKYQCEESCLPRATRPQQDKRRRRRIYGLAIEKQVQQNRQEKRQSDCDQNRDRVAIEQGGRYPTGRAPVRLGTHVPRKRVAQNGVKKLRET
jgi:hypothetical protein